MNPTAQSLEHEWALREEFETAFREAQAALARAWRAAAAVANARPDGEREHVGDDLALVMGVHPRSGQHLVFTAVAAARVPGLLEAMEAGRLTDRHVVAMLDEATRWTDNDEAHDAVLALTLDRMRDTKTWPTPHDLRRRVRTAALLLDLTAAEKTKRSASQRRGVSASPIGIGSGSLCVEGPDLAVGHMMAAIRARADAMGGSPADTRTLQQRLFDAAYELVTVDAAGGPSAVPTLNNDGEPVELTVPAAEFAFVVPFSVAAGGDLELAEIVGYGPILPSTARDLLANADRVCRVAVDADSGQVIAVDSARLAEVATPPVVGAPPGTESYRPSGRLRTFVEHRDRPLVRPRPSRSVATRFHDRREPALPLSTAPPPQASEAVRRRTRSRRHNCVDPPNWPPPPPPTTELVAAVRNAASTSLRAAYREAHYCRPAIVRERPFQPP